jgi:hypothetical protein
MFLGTGASGTGEPGVTGAPKGGAKGVGMFLGTGAPGVGLFSVGCGTG